MIIEAKLILPFIHRHTLEEMLETLREQNISRRVYVMYEGNHPEPAQYSDDRLIEAILEELQSTVNAMNSTDAYNRPPLTPEEHREETDKDIAAEFGYSDVEEYKKAERAWAAEQMNKFLKEQGIDLKE